MSLKRPAKIQKLFLLVFITLNIFSAHSQTHNPPVSNPENKELLNSIEMRAKENVANNLNRFAVEKLKTYNFWLDSLYQKEKRDTLAKIEKAYRTGSADKISKIENYKKKIAEYSAQKTALETRYWTLVKKSTLAFGVWLTIVSLLLIYRKKTIKSAQARLDKTLAQLGALEESMKKSERLLGDFKNLREPIHKLNTEYEKLSSILGDTGTSDVSSPELSEISAKTVQMKKVISSEDSLMDAVTSQSVQLEDEKVSSDINSICEQYLEIVARGFQKSEEFNFQVTRDFEKRLPSIKINPAAVGTLLLNVLTNAFQSVKDKNKLSIKGYQPKVSISTRILPRFLQIRVKDNGLGMTENILKNSTNEFFSTRPLAEGPGLGLYFAHNIISEIHKGEIKIESEAGNSTDVYIKFYI